MSPILRGRPRLTWVAGFTRPTWVFATVEAFWAQAQLEISVHFPAQDPAGVPTTVIRLSLEQLAKPEDVEAVHKCGARVSVTTLGKEDNEEGIRRVITEGAELIETDHPDVVARIRHTAKYTPAH